MKKLILLSAFLLAIGQAFATKYSIIYSDFGFNSENTELNTGDSTIFSKSALNSNPFESKIVNGRLQINFKSGATSGMVGLHDILGNKIFEGPATENIDWSLAGLRSGIYILVWKENRNSFTKRIVYRQE